jgi:hypothetical protein
MQSNEKIIEIGKFLPWGSQKRIAEKTALTTVTINHFFKTGKASPETMVKILEASKPYFEAAKKLKKAQEELLEVMSI